MVATLRAAQQGVSVIGIDKQDAQSLWIGGDLGPAGGQLHISSMALGTPPDQLLAAMTAATGQPNTDVAVAHANNAGRAFNWLLNYIPNGIQTYPPAGNTNFLPLKTDTTWVNQKPGGPADFRNFGGYKCALALEAQVKAQPNVTTLYNTRAVQLLTDATGRVSGAVVQDSQGKYVINAGAVILATGGYHGNKDMLVRYVGGHADEPARHGWPGPCITSSTHPSAISGTGDGHLMALEVGAAMRSMSYVGFSTPCPAASKYIPDLVYQSMVPLQAGIIVNNYGQRFCDENLGNRIYSAIMLKTTIFSQGFYILDSTLYAQPTISSVLKTSASLGATIYTANDIPSLATAAGIDPYLATEITNFNAAIDNKTIGQLPVPKTGTAITKIATPPFYAVPFSTVYVASYGGLQINTQGNILDRDGNPIAGLYASGIIMAGSINGGKDSGSGGYASGMLSCGLIWGLISSESAAAYVTNGMTPPASSSTTTTTSKTS